MRPLGACIWSVHARLSRTEFTRLISFGHPCPVSDLFGAKVPGAARSTGHTRARAGRGGAEKTLDSLDTTAPFIESVPVGQPSRPALRPNTIRSNTRRIERHLTYSESECRGLVLGRHDPASLIMVVCSCR